MAEQNVRPQGAEEYKLPAAVTSIIERLETAGYEAYAVGGCVRDMLLSREPNDWDITTSASPQQVKQVFRKTVDTGIEHGTVTVVMEHENYEVTTYRVDGVYLDGRHPSGVTFTASLSEDLKRRDFTINAMAFHPKRGLIDLYNGREDLAQGVIRCVGTARERFSEDALRILRAFRFAAQLGFSIDEETLAAAQELAANLELISKERIAAELVKLLTSDHPEEFMNMYEAGVTKYFLPEFTACMETEQNTPFHSFNVGVHTMRVVCGVRADRVLRLAALLHDIAKPKTKTVDENGRAHFYYHAKLGAKMAEGILRDLKFDNDTIRRVTHLIEYHDDRKIYGADEQTAGPKDERGRRRIRRAMNRIGSEDFPLLLELMRADANGKLEEPNEGTLLAMKGLDDAERYYSEILAAGECVSLKDLKITGRDLIAMGYTPGPGLGEKLNELLLAVVDDPSLNTREALTERAKAGL
ncbi:MAG: CCA tRNA nucleotidyltransferase [Lachnospiraceae bacterium]|nr:CCA tRNA nucleotidyltransferase [Lachnospiraceae bacterium]